MKRGVTKANVQNQHLFKNMVKTQDPIIAYAYGEMDGNGRLMGYSGSREFVQSVAKGRMVRVRLEVLR